MIKSQEMTDHGQKEPNNNLVKKSELNEIKSLHSLKVSRTEGRSKGQHLKIRRPSKLADNVNC